MTVKPIKKYILVAQNKDQPKTSSGIIIDTAYSALDTRTATVLAIGPEVELVKVGDKVLLEWNHGHVVTIDGAGRVMIKEEFVVAVIEKGE